MASESKRNCVREASPFAVWQEHCERGQFAYQECPQTLHGVFSPRVIALRTGRDDLVWRTSKGMGTVYSTTTLPFKDGPTANLAPIDLDEGIRRMQRALAEWRLDGVRTTAAFHRRLLDSDALRNVDIHTRFIEEEFFARPAVGGSSRQAHPQASGTPRLGRYGHPDDDGRVPRWSG